MLRFFLWLSRLWHNLKESKEPHIKVRQGWDYNKRGDTRRDE